jgi:hypothetical protein
LSGYLRRSRKKRILATFVFNTNGGKINEPPRERERFQIIFKHFIFQNELSRASTINNTTPAQMSTEKKSGENTAIFHGLFGAFTKWYPPVDMKDTKQDIVIHMGRSFFLLFLLPWPSSNLVQMFQELVKKTLLLMFQEV